MTYRNDNGSFAARQELKVPRLGPKAYQQAVGFLRIIDGREPLDNTDIHRKLSRHDSVQALGTDQTIGQLSYSNSWLNSIKPSGQTS